MTIENANAGSPDAGKAAADVAAQAAAGAVGAVGAAGAVGAVGAAGAVCTVITVFQRIESGSRFFFRSEVFNGTFVAF